MFILPDEGNNMFYAFFMNQTATALFYVLKNKRQDEFVMISLSGKQFKKLNNQ